MLFRGRMRWFGAMFMAMILVFSVLAVVCGVRVLGAPRIEDMLRWGAGFFLCYLAAMGGKTWYRMHVERLAIIREIKRVEPLIAGEWRRLVSFEGPVLTETGTSRCATRPPSASRSRRTRRPARPPADHRHRMALGRPGAGRGCAYCRSYTATEPAAPPCAPVGVCVTVRVLLSFETTTFASNVAFPPFFQTFS